MFGSYARHLNKFPLQLELHIAVQPIANCGSLVAVGVIYILYIAYITD